MKKAYYAPDTDFYYEGINKGDTTHIEVEFKPSKNHVLDKVTFRWYIPFEVNKVLFQEKITIERDKRIIKGFAYNTKQISCDNTSQANANAFLTMNSLGFLPFPVKWRTIDNSIIEIVDNVELITFGTTMLEFVQTVFQESWTVKDVIESATRIEDVESAYEGYING